MLHAKTLLGPILAGLVASTTATFHVSGCNKQHGLSSAADASYASETLLCVKMAKTQRESRECRAQVNQRFGLCPSATLPCPEDGGL